MAENDSDKKDPDIEWDAQSTEGSNEPISGRDDARDPQFDADFDDIAIEDYMAEEWEAELTDDLAQELNAIEPGEAAEANKASEAAEASEATETDAPAAKKTKATKEPASRHRESPPPRKVREHKKRRSLVLPILMLTVAGAAALAMWQAPSLARKMLEEKLHAGGFPHARVDKASISMNAITAENVKIDEYGFDEIANIHADISWPALLTGGDVKSLSLSGIKIGRDATMVKAYLHRLTGDLLRLPDYRISITDAAIDVTTDFGEVRVYVDASVQPDIDTGTQTLNARVQSSQFQLGFDSTWKGTLSPNGNLDLSAEVTEGRMNIGPLRVSRYSGWIGLAVQDGRQTLESQMIAGSANFMDVPLHNLSLVSAYETGATQLIIRSGISGMPDVLFTGDLSKTDDQQTFTAILAGYDLGLFLDYIEEATGTPKEIRAELIDFGPFSFAMEFEPEKRFVGGPLPFSIALSSNGIAKMGGNALIYPDTLDVRGSMETDVALASALQEYFKIPSENMRHNFIRLDGGLRRFFTFGAPAEAIVTEEDPDTAPLVFTE